MVYMIRLRHVWIAVLVLVLPYATLSDVVMLRNGDRLTGTVLGMKGDTLRFESGDGAVLHFAWKEVRELLLDRSTTVVLQNGESVTGPLLIGDDGHAVSSHGETPSVVDISRVAVIHSPKWGARYRGWRSTGVASLAAKIERGNAELDDVDADLRFSLRKRRHRVSFIGEIERDQSDGLDTKHKWSARTRYDRFFNKTTYGILGVSSEGDEFAELDLRNWVAFGVGHDLRDDRTFRVAGQALLLRVLDEHKTKDNNRYWAARLAFNLEKSLLEGRLTFYLLGSLTGDVDQTERYFYEGRTGFRAPIWGGLVAIAEAKAEYDNVPSGEAEKSDYTYRLKVGYQW
jgi:hypothetical protein